MARGSGASLSCHSEWYVAIELFSLPICSLIAFKLLKGFKLFSSKSMFPLVLSLGVDFSTFEYALELERAPDTAGQVPWHRIYFFRHELNIFLLFIDTHIPKTFSISMLSVLLYSYSFNTIFQLNLLLERKISQSRIKYYAMLFCLQVSKEQI